jgi:hypothetical protein
MSDANVDRFRGHTDALVPTFAKHRGRYCPVAPISGAPWRWPAPGLVRVVPNGTSVLCPVNNGTDAGVLRRRVAIESYADVLRDRLGAASGLLGDWSRIEQASPYDVAAEILTDLAHGYGAAHRAHVDVLRDAAIPASASRGSWAYLSSTGAPGQALPNGTRLYRKHGGRYRPYREVFDGFSGFGAWVVPALPNEDFRLDALIHLEDLVPPPSTIELAHGLPGLIAAVTRLQAARVALHAAVRRDGSAIWLSRNAVAAELLNGLAGIPVATNRASGHTPGTDVSPKTRPTVRTPSTTRPTP